MTEKDDLKIGVVGNMISTTVVLADGRRIQVLASEKAIAKQILAYRKALNKLRGTDHADAEESGSTPDLRPD